jgi:hypothetical protein
VDHQPSLSLLFTTRKTTSTSYPSSRYSTSSLLRYAAEKRKRKKAPTHTKRDLDHSTDHVSIGSLSKFVCIWHFNQFSSLKCVCSYQGDHRIGRYSELPLGRSTDCLLLQVLFGSWVTCHLVGLGSAINKYLWHGRVLSMLFSDINIQ